MSEPNTECMYVLLETTRPSNDVQISAVYDDIEQAKRRTLQIAERRTREFNEALGEQPANTLVAFELAAETPLQGNEILAAAINKITTVITPAGYIYSESREATTESVHRFSLMTGCNRFRINNVLKQVSEAEGKVAAAENQSAEMERTFANRCETYAAQIEGLRARVEEAARFKKNYTQTRRLADEYLADITEMKSQMKKDSERITQLEANLKTSRGIGQIYLDELNRLKELLGEKDDILEIRQQELLLEREAFKRALKDFAEERAIHNELEERFQELTEASYTLRVDNKQLQIQLRSAEKRTKAAEAQLDRVQVQQEIQPSRAPRASSSPSIQDLQFAALLQELQSVQANMRPL